MRIINPHHSKKQQAGPCHEKLHSVRQKASEGHGQMQQHKVAMTNAMQWSPLNSPLHSGAGALHSLWSTPEAAALQLKDKSCLWNHYTQPWGWNSHWPYHIYYSPWFPIAVMVRFRLICRHFIIYTKCHGSLINISGLFPNNFSIRSWWKQAVSTPGRNTPLMATVAVWPSGLPGESPSGKAVSRLHSWSWSDLGGRWPLFQEDDDGLSLWGT